MENNIKILIVDDEQIVLDSIKKHLRNEQDLLTYTAPNVDAALLILAQQEIDIVLTDLMMPEIDGLEFLKILREKNKNIITVMITGYATINTALQAQQLGAFDYIAKPFTRDELMKIVHRAEGLVIAIRKQSIVGNINLLESDRFKSGLKGIGEHSWFMKEEAGTVLIGVERPFLYSMGKIQNVYLPEVGDELRQGSVYFQLFSSDLRSDTLLSPLSGTVVAVNDWVTNQPNEALQDPYGQGWLIRISPINFDEEIKVLGL